MKFMLLQDYGGIRDDVPVMSEWAPEEIEAHIEFQKDFNAELKERGEFVEAQALSSPELAKFVVSGGRPTPSSPTAPSRSRRSCSPATG